MDSGISVVDTPPRFLSADAGSRRRGDAKEAEGEPTPAREQRDDGADQVDTAVTPTSRVVMDLVAQMHFVKAHTGNEARRGVSEQDAFTDGAPTGAIFWTPTAFLPALPPCGLTSPANLTLDGAPMGNAGAAGGSMPAEESGEACNESEDTPLLTGVAPPEAGARGGRACLLVCVSLALLSLVGTAMYVAWVLGLVGWWR